MRALITSIVLIAAGCKPPDTSISGVKDAGSTAMTLRVVKSGIGPAAVFRVTPVTTGMSIVGITALELQLPPQSVAASGATVTLPAMSYQLRVAIGGTELPCQGTLVPVDNQPVTGTCIGTAPAPAPAATPTPTPTTVVSPSSFTAASYAHEFVYQSGMVCRSNYGANKWQKQFDVSLRASTEALAAVKSVKYIVHSGYNGGNGFVITNRATNFATDTRFVTPVKSWTIADSFVELLNGTTLTLPGGTLSWSDTDAAQPAGGLCTPTPSP